MELKELFGSMVGRTIEGIGLTNGCDVEMFLNDGRTITFETDGDCDFLVRYVEAEEKKARQ